MTPLEAFDRFIIKSEKNSTNDGISTDKGRFRILFNERQNRFVEYCYEHKNSDFIRYIQCLLKDSEGLKKESFTNYELFELPNDYFNFSSIAKAKASNKICSFQDMYLYELKDFNKNITLSNNYTKPDFNYREAPYEILDNKLKVFVENFKMDLLTITYYRYPIQIEQYDNDNPESEFKEIELDFDDKVLDRIITSTVSGFDINNMSQRWQLNDLESKEKL